MRTELNRRCPICKHNYGKSMKKINMNLPDFINLPKSYNVVICEQCGFSFADNNASLNDYEQYYTDCNNYSQQRTLIKDETKNDYSNMRLRLMERYIQNKKDSILDIGCGSGLLLEYMRNEGYENLLGLDPSQESIEILKSKGINYKQGSIFCGEYTELYKRFDIIMCTGVLEHLLDLHMVIRNIDTYLRERGKIFVIVPAVEGFEEYIHKIPNYFNHEHINYFSRNSLDNLFLAHKYKRISRDKESFFYTQLNSNIPEKSLCAVYEKSVKTEELRYDKTSENSIRNYFRQAKKMERKELQYCQNLVSKGDSFIVWGTGAYAMKLVGEVTGLEDKIMFFVDNNSDRIEREFLGKVIKSPEELYHNQEEIILIASMKYSDDIVKQIKDMGLKNKYIVI